MLPRAQAIRPAAKFTKFVDYDMSAMTDTKGGFLSAEDDASFRPGASSAKQQPGTATDENARPQHMTAREWERLQVLRSLERNRAGKFEPGISVLDEPEKKKRCRECSSMEIDWVWDDVFHLSVCSRCKERYPEKYSLLTKTECKEDYLLTDPELRDPELLPHLSKPNPHKSHWHDMMLFLRIQVEEYAIRTKWGSAEALDQEYERREAQKKARKEAKFRDKLTELKRKTRTEAFRRQAAVGRGGAGSAAGPSRFGDAVGSAARHVHDWGRIVVNEDGMSVKTCVECGMEVEEMEL
ncbi:DNA-repair protein complementing XP-A cells [Geosmithia morbida]|uniref:DNA repair protein RAD14 n=1 Tax=Geosmithia morbida TaxID=1094350 RepID=A0A9P4YNN6_9HYPO|nr:DNA-repair protein complementing XP-A cells [Geosmithia morbida]KAF4119230.1 DNA-repair protein complementing XP-A cells [Geosmithia morbida]